MPTVKINTQHHYVTLKVEFADKRRYNLTVSHSGTRGTATAPASLPPEDKAVFNRVFKAFDAATWTDKTAITGTVGERVKKLADIAQGCHTSVMLAERFELAVGAAPKLAQTAREATVSRLAAEVLKAASTSSTKMAAVKAAVAAKSPSQKWDAAKIANGEIALLPGEGSGKFMQRLWMAGHNDPDALVALVRQHYVGRTTTRSDVAYNVNQLRKQHGAAAVPAWPKKG